MMRPDFLLNFVSLAPLAQEVKDSDRAIFPSVLGIRLSSRLGSSAFKRVMANANEASSVDETRDGSMITEFVNSLEGDNVKVYENTFESLG